MSVVPMPEGIPNPGSVEALALGCRCPVMDNNHGKWPHWRGWLINPACPVHMPNDSPGEALPPASP